MALLLAGIENVLPPNDGKKIIWARKYLFESTLSYSYIFIRRWQKMQKQPFYSVLTNKGDSRYVAQENIQLVGGKLRIFELGKIKPKSIIRKFQIDEQENCSD